MRRTEATPEPYTQFALKCRRFPHRKVVDLVDVRVAQRPAGWETRDTADWEACGTGLGWLIGQDWAFHLSAI
jgi:hypothetical protein